MKKPLLIFILLIGCYGIAFPNNFDPDTCLVEKSMIKNPNGDKSICVVFTVNAKQLERFKITYRKLRSIGDYKGDVVLLICDDLNIHDLRRQKIFQAIHIVKYKNIKPVPDLYLTFNITTQKYKIQPQINKMNIFHTFFKKWDYLFYIDCGMQIHRKIQPMLDLKEKGHYLAHSDGYPKYLRKLKGEFNQDYNPICYHKLNALYNLHTDFPQSTMMLFDTSLIKNNTLKELIELMYEFPISKTNEQAYIALYFGQDQKVWKQILLKKSDNQYYYD